MGSYFYKNLKKIKKKVYKPYCCGYNYQYKRKIQTRRSNVMMIKAIAVKAELDNYSTNSTYMEWIA
ncbi:hypothetical protein DFO73_11060 [Cytobacillus oceanisediminis]|uniref:Uncharacterized protein n=1 Tax=Cytobacillus oceanisediminis TaxID=665099 RepID=A0A2V2ZT37_9BACI|nr:hypothetical protein DFO73_11060 [Cytobacillus oceanisediminis]